MSYEEDLEGLLQWLNNYSKANNHIELLADKFFEMLQVDDCEFGGIGLDSKRPFGNSHVERDIADIVGIEYIYDDEELDSYLRDLYYKLPTYLKYRWANLKAKANDKQDSL